MVLFEPYSPLYEWVIEPPGTPFELLLTTSSTKKILERRSPKVPGKNRVRAWKSFEHFKSVSTPPSRGFDLPVYVQKDLWIYRGIMKEVYSAYAQDDVLGVNAEPYGDGGQLDSGLPAFIETGPDGDYIPSPVDVENMNSYALKHMLPYIKQQLSLVNSVFELRDLKSLPKTARSLVRTIKEFLNTKKVKGNPRLSLKELCRQAGDTYLQWKFGISPLISDIVGIYNSLVGLEKRINDLISRAGRPQIRHYAFRWVEFPDVIDELSPQYQVYGTYSPESGVGPAVAFSANRNVRYAPSTFHAEIEYNYNYTRYQIEHARLLSTLDSLGVKLSPSIIWNAIPWSFVVDWVLRIGDYLDKFEVSNMEPQINILRYLWSVKRTRQIIVKRGLSEALSGDFVVPGLGLQYHYPSVQQTSYKRVVGLPSKSSIESSGLSSTEFTLAAALVVSRKRRYHKRG